MVAANALSSRIQAAENLMETSLKGKINHSVCRWCYGNIKLDDLAVAAKKMGINSVELLIPAEFATIKKHGLTCALVMGLSDGFGIEKGWVRYSATETPRSGGYYAAHFWVDHTDKSFPQDALMALGFEAQSITIVPSKELVVVRLGCTPKDDFDRSRLVKDIVAAIR